MKNKEKSIDTSYQNEKILSIYKIYRVISTNPSLYGGTSKENEKIFSHFVLAFRALHAHRKGNKKAWKNPCPKFNMIKD